jgi:undecaprenyl-phosphate galactose phosphotransferase
LSKFADHNVTEIDSSLEPSVGISYRETSAGLDLKRGFDLVSVLIILTIAAPVMIVLWLLVRLDGGPGLYGHERVGRGERTFRCLKFRTMVTNADTVLAELLAADIRAREEWEASRKLVNDPRVTRIGWLLRATSLDELPQLLNVLRGDMSLVGPRPVVRAELDQFYRGEYRAAYLSVRPGVTGLWQVSGRSDASYDRRVAFDLEYVANASMGMDLTILWRTVGAVLRRRGAY